MSPIYLQHESVYKFTNYLIISLHTYCIRCPPKEDCCQSPACNRVEMEEKYSFRRVYKRLF